MAETTPAEITSRRPEIEIPASPASSPAVLYITRDDRLYIRSVAITGTRTARIAGRLLHPDGVIRPFRFDVTLAADTADVQTFELSEGYLISLTLTATEAGTAPGRCYAELGLLRGRAADLDRVALLSSGAFDLASPLSWPNGRRDRSTQERGFHFHTGTADPAAGAEWTVTLNANHETLVRGIRVQLVTDATVANRFPRVEFVSGASILWRSHPHAAQIASLTRDYNFVLGGQHIDAAAAAEYQNFLPNIILPPGAIVRGATDGLQAGDNYGAARLQLEQWFAR